MPDDPWYIELLDKLGVNTTRLRWRLYQREQQAKNLVHGKGPTGLRWLQYPHKVCPNCTAVNDREARICSSCETRLPSMLRYRLTRLFRTLVPSEGPVVTQVFLGLIVLAYLLTFAANGFAISSLMQPSGPSLAVLGSFSGDWAVTNGQYWRFLSFGLLHGGLIHFGMIAYSLYQIGQLIEMQINSTRMLALITLTQISAAFGSFVWYSLWKDAPGITTVGGSGWLYGLIGFGIAYFHQMGPGARQMRDSLIKWAVIFLVFGFVVKGINNAAHIGGMLAGLAFAYIPQETRYAVPEGAVGRAHRSNAIWSGVFATCTVLWCATLFFMAKSLVQYWPDLMSLQ